MSLGGMSLPSLLMASFAQPVAGSSGRHLEYRASFRSARRAAMKGPPAARHRPPAAVIALGGCTCGRNDGLLEPADRVQMVARPHEPNGRRGLGPVAAVQVAADRLYQAAVGGSVVGQRVTWLAAADQAARQVVVPGT